MFVHQDSTCFGCHISVIIIILLSSPGINQSPRREQCGTRIAENEPPKISRKFRVHPAVSGVIKLVAARYKRAGRERLRRLCFRHHAQTPRLLPRWRSWRYTTYSQAKEQIFQAWSHRLHSVYFRMGLPKSRKPCRLH